MGKHKANKASKYQERHEENEDSKFSFWTAVGIVSVVKLLFVRSYRSTDFEVHRNWLAVTYSLPLSKWYYEETSQWTLDYPPFFGYLEWMLSQIARFVDANMLKISNLNYDSVETILFQKVSVIVLDLVLAFGVSQCSSAIKPFLPKGVYRTNAQITLFALIFTNAGLFIVDQIHFQYNGFLFGILLLSLTRVLEGKYMQGAGLFMILLNFKHIFLYIAPAYGVYYLSRYCIRNSWATNLKNFVSLGVITVLVFACSFGPFYQHVPQILKRLFPFKRGLSHAYWAPNVWALYNSLDLVLKNVDGKHQGKSNITSGLVGDTPLSVLPAVQPIHTFALTGFFLLPILWKLWKFPTELNFLQSLVLVGWTSFMFGYHVHEKAILNVILPFALIAVYYPKNFLLTLIPGTFSLFPLLFTPFEMIHKLLLCVIHVGISMVVLPSFSVKWYEAVYVIGFTPLYFLENLGPVFIPSLPFLPLLCISDYCFVGIFYNYILVYCHYCFSSSLPPPEKVAAEPEQSSPALTEPEQLEASEMSLRSTRRRNK